MEELEPWTVDWDNIIDRYDEKQYTSEDFRFTYKNGYIYAFCMRPDSDTFVIKSLKLKGERDIVLGSVEALGDIKIASTSRNEEGLKITFENMQQNDKPICFKIEIV